MYPSQAQAPQGLTGLRAWANGKGPPINQQNSSWAQYPSIPTTIGGHPLPVQQAARVQPQSDAFNIQLMQMQLRILQARQANVRQKQLLGRQIISQQRQAILAAPSYSQVPDYELPQSLFPSNVMGYGDNRPRRAGDGAALASSEAASASARDYMGDSREIRQSRSAGSRSTLGESSGIEDDQPKEVSRAPPSKPAIKTNHKLLELSELVSQAVDTNSKHLNAAMDDHLPSDKKNKKVQRREQAKHRQDIESLLQSKPNNAMEILPRWKHLYLYNNPNPALSTVMKPYRLFRVVAWAVAYIVTGPLLAVYKRKEKSRERARRDFKRSLELFVETVDDWMGRATQLPLASIVQDSTIDFDSKESSNRAGLVQLKVRLRAVVQNLCQLDMPPPHITTFLSSLISDGNYFPTSFLWPCESAALDFDRLGATRCMLSEVDPLFASKVPYKASVPTDASATEAEGGTPTRLLDVGRARLLLAHYLLVRVLVYRLCLTPWHCKLCPPPANRQTRRVVHNLRMLASLLYLLARLVTGDVLPALPEKPTFQPSQALAASSATAARGKEDPSSSSGEGLAPGRLLSSSTTDTPTADKPSLQHKASTGSIATAGSEEAIGPKGVLKSVLKLVGFADVRPGHEVFKQDSIEFRLLQPSTNIYCTLEELHRLLLSTSQLGGVETTASEWLEELVRPLSSWLQRLTEHILAQKFRSGGGGDIEIATTAP